MIDVEDNLSALQVVKRNGKKVEWNGTKIAVAIKKGFDSIKDENEENKYTEKDINKIFNSVVKRIENDYLPQEKIKIEQIQDLIEESLQKKGYDQPRRRENLVYGCGGRADVHRRH